MTHATYCIAHKGYSTGSMVGLGPVKKYWSTKRIYELAKQIKDSPVFYMHERDDSPDRKVIGTIINNWTVRTKLGLELHVAVELVSTFARRMKKGKLDTASIEAELIVQRSGKKIFVRKVEKFLGLALADSECEPGFERARLVEVL